MNKDRFFFTDYEFTGKHAEYVKSLTNVLVDKNEYRKQIRLFETNVSVLVTAPLVGYLYNRKAEKEPNNDSVAKVAGSQMMSNSEDIKYAMVLILLLDEEYEPSIEKRIDRAFKFFGENESDFELLEQYTRGGIEVLYEKIMGDDTNPFDIAYNLMSFLEDFNSTFNRKIGSNDIIRLCNEFEGKQK